MMEIILSNFGTSKNSLESDCIFVDECGRNTCDCEYNCYNDDDCTQDTWR